MELDSTQLRQAQMMTVLEEFFDRGGEAKCPAAQVGRYSDTRNRYLNCKVEDRLRPGHGHFAIGSNPTGVFVFCCDEYIACPVWQAERDGDPVTERVRSAYESDESKAATKRQIESGMRVDDRGLEAEQGEDVVTRHLDDEVAEAAAEVARRNAERRYSE